MITFQEYVARDLLKNTQTNLSDFVIVFPNRRAGRIFLRILSKFITKPQWAPQVFSMDDWVVKLSGFQVMDPLKALYILYEEVSRHLKTDYPFLSFLDWGDMLLSDFDDLDKYLVDPVMLFQNLSDLHEIEKRFPSLSVEQIQYITRYWKTFQPHPSVYQQNWLDIWEHLPVIYHAFEKRLTGQGWATSGQCYRSVAGRIYKQPDLIPSDTPIAFVGFNALTRSELQIFRYCREFLPSRFYWDAHPFFLEKGRDAGRFIRQLVHQFPPPQGFNEQINGRDNAFSSGYDLRKEIRVIASSTRIAQLQLLFQELEDLPGDNPDIQSGKIGVVLPDENDVKDLLKLWPGHLPKVNATSGYPVSDAQISGWVAQWMEVQSQIKIINNEVYYSSSGLDRLINYSVMQGLIPDHLRKLLSRHPNAWIPASQLISSDGTPFLPDGTETDTRPVELLVQWLKHLAPALQPFGEFEMEVLRIMQQWLMEIRSLLPLDASITGRQTLRKLYQQYFNNKRIYPGSDTGAPVMVCGVLETRVLDFEKLYVLSFNEGNWPSTKLPASMIPYAMRKAVGLPTAEHRDAMYAYYFYRLIQRSRLQTLFFLNSASDDGGGLSKKSRFINQLRYDSPFTIIEKVQTPRMGWLNNGERIIEKTPAIIRQIYKITGISDNSRSLSPSAINTYLDCPLQFAFKYIYGMREPDKGEVAGEPRQLGRWLHEAMEILYAPLVGQTPAFTGEWFQRAKEEEDYLDNLIQKALSEREKKFDSKPVKDGLTEITRNILSQYIKVIIRTDHEILPFQILSLEKKYSTSVLTDMNGKKVRVRLSGVVDRLDSTPDDYRILDYKTGKANLKMVSIHSNHQALQLLIYGELLNANLSQEKPVHLGLYRVKNLRSGEKEFMLTEAGKSPVDYRVHRKQFLSDLSSVLEEMLNPDIPFKPVYTKSVCEYCLYSSLCDRVDS